MAGAAAEHGPGRDTAAVDWADAAGRACFFNRPAFCFIRRLIGFSSLFFLNLSVVHKVFIYLFDYLFIY